MLSQIRHKSFPVDRILSSGLPKNLSNLLAILASTFLAGNPNCDVKINGCTADIYVLRLVNHLGFKVSEARLIYWFELNRDTISGMLNSDEFKSWYYDILKSLDHVIDKRSVLDTMHQISNLNTGKSVNVQALIALTERYWSHQSLN